MRRAAIVAALTAIATLSSLVPVPPAAAAPLPPIAPTTVSALMSNTPANLGWGVVGFVTPATTRENAEVWALQEIGNRLFVGGTFQRVRNNNAGQEFAQPFLAAFDATTGAWISTFRPTVNATVFDLDVTPDGRLLVAGEFTSINGVAGTAALAALDPLTGQVVNGWRATVTEETDTSRAVVRAIDQFDGWVYVGGDFSHITGPDGVKQRIYRAGRVAAANGRPDTAFRPRVGGASVWDLWRSRTQDRVILGGRFSAVNGSTVNQRFAVVTASTGALLPRPAYVPSHPTSQYLQTVYEINDQIVAGGAEHFLDFYRTDGSRLMRHITYFGGDFQAITAANGVVYAACHCYELDYEGAEQWRSTGVLGGGIPQPITWIGAYNPATGRQIVDFQPRIAGMRDGPWELYVSPSSGCLWFGGDVKSSYAPSFWIGGFSRVCPPGDTTAPSVPQNVAGTVAADGRPTLTWAAATDNVGVAGYRIFRNGTPIADVTAPTFTDAALTAVTNYQVIAFDAAGNTSGSLAGLELAPNPGGPPEVLVPFGATWRYLTGTSIPATWAARTFDDAAWPAGPAQLGWGDGDEATNIDPGATIARRTVWFRRAVQVADPGRFTTLTVDVIRDDGVAVYVNGVEIGRNNLPAGPLTAATYATTFVAGADETTPVTFTVPAGVLVAGTNVVAVELHGVSGASNNDASFDLRLVAQ